MLKRFSITLVILSTLVYGSMFFMSKYYGTSFFDEILMQMNRLNAGLTKRPEIQQTKTILLAVINNEHPPENWDHLIVHDRKSSNKDLFYHYKVWTIMVGLSHKDVEKSYPIFKEDQQNMTILNMRYGNKKPVVQFPLFRDSSGNLISGLFYPINELPFSADLNKDNIIDQKDVDIARKKT